MVIVQSAEISTQPHTTLRIHKDTADRALGQAAVFYGITAVGCKRISALMINIQIIESTDPQTVL